MEIQYNEILFKLRKQKEVRTAFSSRDLKRIGLCFVFFFQNDSFLHRKSKRIFLGGYCIKLLRALKGNNLQN